MKLERGVKMQKPSITAVILGYWEERKSHLIKIYDSLRLGTVRPNKILFFLNNPDLMSVELSEIFNDAKVNGIVVSKNFGHRARFVSALLNPTDYYYFIDDDRSLGLKTLENFYNHAKVLDNGVCLTYLGRRISENGHGLLVKSENLKSMYPVDHAEGVGSLFCDFQAIVNMLQLEEKLRKNPFYNYGREADIILSMANRCFVLPSRNKYEPLIDLGQEGVGMYQNPGHREKRILISREIKKLLGEVK